MKCIAVAGARTLRLIGIERWLRLGGETFMANVADDTDDRERMQIAIHVSKLDDLADWILVRPFGLRQRGADQRDVRRVGLIASVERPAAQQRNVHCTEILAVDD